MLLSMTGFGSGQATSDLGALSVEVRSVNHRALDLSLRLPSDFSSLEPVARQEIQRRLHRGKIYVNVQWSPVPGATQQYKLNEALLEMLVAACKARGEADPQPDRLLAIPGVVVSQADESQQEALEAMLRKALGQALDGLLAERAREGQALVADLQNLHRSLKGELEAVEGARGEVVEKYRQRLHERIEELLGAQKGALDPGRLEQEVAIFADKADIGEEVTRLAAHLDRLEASWSEKDPEPAGRGLDFLAQEILREVNTIGSKCRDLTITSNVLQMKVLVDGLKEQVANIE